MSARLALRVLLGCRPFLACPISLERRHEALAQEEKHLPQSKRRLRRRVYRNADDLMFVSIHLQSASEPIEYHEALGCFEKGRMFCVYFRNSEGEKMTDKYPIQNIHKVRNSYTTQDRGEKNTA